MKPYRYLNKAHMGADGRIISYLQCKLHQCTDKIKWPDGSDECMMCAADRQIAMMTPKQQKNIGYNMPYIASWVQS